MKDIQKLYELYSVDIYKFILSLSKDTYIADDVMQSTFLSAIKSLDTFKGNSSVKTWLIGIAKNEYYTYRRKNALNNSLEDVLVRLNMNMSNNYKDAAQSNLKEFEELFKELKDSGKLNEKQKKRYEELLNEYKEKMKDYSHKDQKPFWV